MRLGFLPIDNRPVCYTLPEQIAGIDGSLEIFMPPREMLGDLTKYADVEKFFEWLEQLPKMDAIVISLDTAAYGGLISSRRCPETFEEIRCRIEKLKRILAKKNARVYAFSSIMRISNNNINEEEKEYWNVWGKEIFNYSYITHKTGENPENSIPEEILTDYLNTRKRNFEINKIYLEWQKEGLFDTLVFSKDDCAEYGLNVLEASELEKLGGFVKTGADEIPLTLMARAFSGEVKIAPVFSNPECKHLISNYEDVSIEQSVNGQIELAGCKVCGENEADIILYVNNFENSQGEIVMKRDTKPFGGIWHEPQKPYMIADVRFANGADNAFVKQIFQRSINEKNFYGYSAWNTSANTLGSLICAAKCKFLAEEFNWNAFKRLETVRFLDDWAYQANVRQKLLRPDNEKIKQLMKPFEEEIAKFLNTEILTTYSFPWNRLFEVEVELI